MKNFWGTVSDKYDPEAGTLVCSAADVSSDLSRVTWAFAWS